MDNKPGATLAHAKPRLDYEALRSIVDVNSNHHLDITKVTVSRFGNDLSEIRLGQTVPFVATADFVITRDGARPHGGVFERHHEYVLFSINNRAEIVTELDVELDASSVARWLRDHFSFSFRVRGLDSSPFSPHEREPVDVDESPTIYPWLQEINTAAVRGEVIDIDVAIQARIPPARTAHHHLLSIHDLRLTFDEDQVDIALAVEGNYAAVDKLINGRYWLTLHSDDEPELKLALRVNAVTARQKPRPTETNQLPAAVTVSQPRPEASRSTRSQSNDK